MVVCVCVCVCVCVHIYVWLSLLLSSHNPFFCMIIYSQIIHQSMDSFTVRPSIGPKEFRVKMLNVRGNSTEIITF
jgi:hypothetical protein